MKINISIKSAGKRRPVLDKVSYEISDTVSTVRTLIIEIVHIEVDKYNRKDADTQMISFLTGEGLDTCLKTGKVGFGRIYSDRKADFSQAAEAALQAYQDGLIRIFQNEEELGTLDTPVHVKENDVFTLMKFVFLAGRMW